MLRIACLKVRELQFMSTSHFRAPRPQKRRKPCSNDSIWTSNLARAAACAAHCLDVSRRLYAQNAYLRMREHACTCARVHTRMQHAHVIAYTIPGTPKPITSHMSLFEAEISELCITACIRSHPLSMERMLKSLPLRTGLVLHVLLGPRNLDLARLTQCVRSCRSSAMPTLPRIQYGMADCRNIVKC